MDETDELAASDERGIENEIAKRLALLTEEQRVKFETRVNNTIAKNDAASPTYQLDILKTFEQELPAHEEARQLGEQRRREDQRAYFDEQRLAHEAKEARQRQRAEPAAAQPRAVKETVPAVDPMQGMRLHDPKQDYGELRRTHEKVAAQQAPLSLDQLQDMEQRHADVRSAQKLEPTAAETKERKELAYMQGQVTERVNDAHGQSPDPHHEQRRELLDHQHFAERVGLEARWIGQHLRKQGSPEAQIYEREARSVYQTARQVHEQRQNLGSDSAQDHARIVRQQDQQNRDDAQQAAVHGTALTSDQRASLTADLNGAREGMEQSDPQKSGRETGDRAQQGNVRADTSRPPQRGR